MPRTELGDTRLVWAKLFKWTIFYSMYIKSRLAASFSKATFSTYPLGKWFTPCDVNTQYENSILTEGR